MQNQRFARASIAAPEHSNGQYTMTTTRFIQRFATVLTLLTLSLTMSMPAQAALESRETALELNAQQILRWPLREGDSLIVRPCDNCAIQTLQVTAETRYSIGFGAEPVLLRELLQYESLIPDNENYLVIVFSRSDNGRVTRIILQTDSQ